MTKRPEYHFEAVLEFDNDSGTMCPMKNVLLRIPKSDRVALICTLIQEVFSGAVRTVSTGKIMRQINHRFVVAPKVSRVPLKLAVVLSHVSHGTITSVPPLLEPTNSLTPALFAALATTEKTLV